MIGKQSRTTNAMHPPGKRFARAGTGRDASGEAVAAGNWAERLSCRPVRALNALLGSKGTQTMRERAHKKGEVYQKDVKHWLRRCTFIGFEAELFGDAYDVTKKAC